MEDLIANARRPVILVAHADDETLWGAGFLLRYPKDWTAICCTVPFHDPERAGKFHDACGVLGVSNSCVLNHSERGGLIPIPDLSEFDLIVTHGAAGEYGHVQHKELHNSIKSRWPDRSMFFGYGGGKPGLTIALSDVEAAKKLEALQKYDHRSPTDHGKMKWQALLDVFSDRFNLWCEPYTDE